MTTNVLQDIIQRCQQRHENPLKQRKTVSVPRLYKGLPYHFTVHCAYRYPVMLQDLEAAGISFMPIGEAPGTDCPPRHFGGERFLKRQQPTAWDAIRWRKSWGLQVYTGMPSARNGAPWHDIDFKYEALCAAPEAILVCVQALVDSVANPLLTISKSGGLRFSCRIPGYLHPHTKQERLSTYQQTPTAENLPPHDAYLEILGEKGHNCWDARYEILLGSLLDPPVIPKEILFVAIDALRAALHEPVPQNIQNKESMLDAPYSLGSGKLDLAKEAFFKRGFSYVSQEDECHYWHRQGSESGNTEVALWENEEGVWLRASTSDTGLPMQATLITDVWKDTGILPPIPATGLPIADKIPAIREGKLSPLAIKRPRPMLHKSEPPEKVDDTHEEMRVQVQRALNKNVRVLGFTPGTDPEKDHEVEAVLQNSEVISIMRENQLFPRCQLSKTTLEAWVANWGGSALGNFALTLLNAVEIRDLHHADAIKRLRTVMQTFEWLEEELIQQMSHVSDPDWTFWHQLKRFFAYYTRDADAPMRWEHEELRFSIPPVLHPSVRHLLVTAPVLHSEHLRRAFFDEEVEVLPPQPMVWAPGTRVFQIRTGIYPRKTILDLSNTWDSLGVSETGQHIFWRLQAEIERDPNIKHGIITDVHAIEQLGDIAKNENVCFLEVFSVVEGLETAFQEAQVIWIVGIPRMGPRTLLERTRILFGNDEEPLFYEMEPELHRYKDERVQSVYEIEVLRIFREIIELAQLNRLANKKIMLITGLRIPDITDRPETLLFDWADFDVAGELDKLAEVIATRQRFEAERDTLTAETKRKEVERVLGCSTRQANRALRRMRGGKIVRVTFREQILELLVDGEKTTPEFAAAIQGHPKAINTELTRLVNRGDIVKVKRGLYTLPKK